MWEQFVVIVSPFENSEVESNVFFTISLFGFGFCLQQNPAVYFPVRLKMMSMAVEGTLANVVNAERN